MTLRQEKLLEELPKNKNIIAKAGRMAGYSDSYCDGRLQADIRKSKVLKTYFDEDTVKNELKKALKQCKNEKDRTNLLRAIELMSKILGMQLDKQEVKATIDNGQQEGVARRLLGIN